MIIIIEGPDGSGKTTLAQQLARQTGFTYQHRSKPKDDEEKARMMGEYLQMCRSKQNLIVDRCWYSEMVYGKVMRDQSYIDYPQMYELERALAKNGAMIIYCTDSPAALWMRATRRGEDYVTCRDDFNAICEEYDKLMNVPHYIPVVGYGFKEV